MKKYMVWVDPYDTDVIEADSEKQAALAFWEGMLSHKRFNGIKIYVLDMAKAERYVVGVEAACDGFGICDEATND